MEFKMKYVDPKFGNSFPDILLAHSYFCKSMVNPSSCPFYEKTHSCGIHCIDWCNKHLEETIKIMGYEVVKGAAETVHDKLCKAIGVKPGEIFYLKENPNHKWKLIYSGLQKKMVLASVNWTHSVEDEVKLLRAVIETPEQIIKDDCGHDITGPLFKAQRLDTGECVEGFYVFDERPLIVQDLAWHILDNGKLSLDHVYPIDPSTLCSYTGKKDRNGEKLFSGDKICFREWHGGSMCWIGTIEYAYGSMYVVRGGPNEECESPFELQLSRLAPENIEKVK